MKIRTVFIVLLYIVFLISGRPADVYGAGEQTFVIGTGTGWNAIESRKGVTEIVAIRPYPVLVLSSALGLSNEPALDMALSFDEETATLFADRTGRYRVQAIEGVMAADRRLARIGMGAALFSGARVQTSSVTNAENRGPLIITPWRKDALFASGQAIQDFSIEFWFFPTNMENGEQVLAWTASNRKSLRSSVQRIQCVASKNRLEWIFSNFFSISSTSDQQLDILLRGSTPLVPRTWSHHLIRFDSNTGLLEYLVNGYPEDIAYTTEGGREGGQIYYPIVGEEGNFVLGSRFMGMLDEFKIYNRVVAEPVLRKYPQQGGWIETKPLDLGEPKSNILRVEVSGGRTSNTGAIVSNEYVENGMFRFADDSTVQFFIRAADSAYHWTGRASAEAEWQSFIPGTDLPGIKGRFVQIGAAFYPSGDGETSPYLEEIRIHYQLEEPPLPPSMITAIARDGAVDLSWKPSYEADVAGYMVYYGTSSGDYFGEGAILGASPINVGKRNAVRIDGLKNGTLYYFAVVAYDQLEPLHIGIFSREITARPLRMIE